MLLVMICALTHGREARLGWSIGEVGTFRLRVHVLHLCRAADRMLAEMLSTRSWMLGTGLG